MSDYFISDLHLFDTGMSKMRGQEPSTILNWTLMNWYGAGITNNDTVYILGDLGSCNHEELSRTADDIVSVLKELPGHKVIVPGNHDIPDLLNHLVTPEGAGIEISGPFLHHGIICTHIPVHPNELKYYKGNIHGHVHLPAPDFGYEPMAFPSPAGPYFNVCVEFNMYTPVKAEFILSRFNKD